MTEQNAAATAPAVPPETPAIPAIAPIETTAAPAGNAPAPAVGGGGNVSTPAATSEPDAGMDLSSLGLTPASPNGGATPVGDDSNMMEMGLDDDSVKAFDFDLYEGRKGQTDRLSIINPNSIMAARVHYKAGAGYFLCQSKFVKQNNQEVMTHQAKCCEKLDAPRKRFACLIVQYTTNPDGSPMNPLGFSLKMWRFSEDKYVLLRNVHKEYPLTAHDVKVTCSEPKFQKLAIQNAKECIWRLPQFPKAYKEMIEVFVKANTPKIPRALGKKKSEQELLEILGLAAAPQMVGAEMPLTDLQSLLPSNG